MKISKVCLVLLLGTISNGVFAQSEEQSSLENKENELSHQHGEYVDHPNVLAGKVSGSDKVAIDLFTNPATNLLVLDVVDTRYPFRDYQIFDPDGKLMHAGSLEDGQNAIDLSHIPKGNYLVQIREERDDFILHFTF